MRGAPSVGGGAGWLRVGGARLQAGRAQPLEAHARVAPTLCRRLERTGCFGDVDQAVATRASLEALGEATTGMNAWVFVDENIATTMKAVKDLTKGWNKAGKEVAFTGAVMDGQFIPANKMAPLEDLPTKLDLITKIAVGIKQVPTKLARGTKGNASKLGYATQAIAEGKSDLIQA